jgi:beta-lactamase superfamily II metal-dependent hydrolase
MAVEPKKVHLRTYQIGFGDCFLMSIEYSNGKQKHILIDFGTMRLAKSLETKQGLWLRRIADNIKDRCDGQLDVVIATHRHKDHVLGFSPDPSDAEGAGEVIRSCNPKRVLQPWTEDAKLATNATDRQALVSGDEAKRASNRGFTAALDNMQSISAAVVDEIRGLADPEKFARPISRSLMEAVEIIGLDQVSNKAAVQNLAEMGTNIYLRYGDDLTKKLKTILPKIKITVLGPPTIDQYKDVEHQAHDHPEFWSLQAMTRNYWAVQAATADLSTKELTRKRKLFPKAKRLNTIPPHDRWFVRQLRQVRADQLMRITQAMDDALNNTSLILLFEIGKKKFLFPGDAQIENWEFVWHDDNPDKDANLALLSDVDVYKVGHHGSTNATPRTIFNNFANTKDAVTAGTTTSAMTSVVSTLGNENNGKWVHGDPDNNSEVPRSTLLEALEDAGELKNTRNIIGSKDLFMEDLVFDV